VAGEIDALSLDFLDGDIAGQPSGDTNALVIDLSGVSFCSVGGVRVLAALLERTNAVAVPLELVVATHAVRRALELLTVPGLFSIHADRGSALTAAARKVAGT
jgi:anti-anti-sigma factor